MRISRQDVLDQYAVSPFESLVNERHCSGESLRYKVRLSVRPWQLKVVHTRPATGEVRGVIDGAGVRRVLQV